MAKLDLINQYGEVSLNNILAYGTSLLSLSNALPAKTGVTAISAQSAASAITIALSTSNTYTDAAVNAAVNAALVTAVTDMNATITKVNAILAALKVVA